MGCGLSDVVCGSVGDICVLPSHLPCGAEGVDFHPLLRQMGMDCRRRVCGGTDWGGAIGALLVYDITRRDTFTHVTKWLEEVKSNSLKSICVILIGNKKDLEDKRQVTYEEGESFAKENGLMFLETSAKTAYNVVEAFNLSAQAIMNNIEKTGVDPTDNKNKVKLNNNSQGNSQTGGNEKKGCC